MRISRNHTVQEAAARASNAQALASSALVPPTDAPQSIPDRLSPGLRLAKSNTIPPMDSETPFVPSMLSILSPRIEEGEQKLAVETVNPGLLDTQADYQFSLQESNSGWLDLSIQLLHAATNKDFTQFSSALEALPPDSCLKVLFTVLYERRSQDISSETTMGTIQNQCNDFQEMLKARGLINGIGSFESLFGWLTGLTGLESTASSYRATSYFDALFVEIHSISGPSDIASPRVEITNLPIRRPVHYLTEFLHKEYHGSFTQYFADLTAPEKEFIAPSICWPVHNTEVIYPGTREDFRNLLISLPVLLVLEVAFTGRACDMVLWDFPAVVSQTKASMDENNCIYDLVTLAMVDPSGTRFITQNSTDTWGYIETPPGYKVCAAVYHLRGGIDTQDQFREHRTSYYAYRYNLQFPESARTEPFTVSCLSALGQRGSFWTTAPEELWIESEPDSDPHKVHDSALSSILPGISPLFSPFFSIRCRCGMMGPGTVLCRLEDGPPIRCEQCGTWSHIACQRSGAFTNDDQFICDTCDPSDLVPRTFDVDKANRALKPGCGAFARFGRCWYPVRIIQKANETSWNVRIWRNCIPDECDVNPGGLSVVQISDIVCSIWQDDMERRTIELGRWVPARGPPGKDRTTAGPPSFLCTDDIFMALANSVQILQNLLYRPETVVECIVPARDWLQANQKNFLSSHVLFCGGLSTMDRAQIANWFEKNVQIHQGLQHRWSGSLAIAHANTLVIAYRIKCAVSSTMSEDFVLQRAWDIQMTGTPSLWLEVDVDQECIGGLEDEMFATSSNLGVDAQHQWGWRHENSVNQQIPWPSFNHY